MFVIENLNKTITQTQLAALEGRESNHRLIHTFTEVYAQATGTNHPSDQRVCCPLLVGQSTKRLNETNR